MKDRFSMAVLSLDLYIKKEKEKRISKAFLVYEVQECSKKNYSLFILKIVHCCDQE